MRPMRNGECGMRNSKGRSLASRRPPLHSAFRIWVVASMSVVVVLHEPQDLVNIAHVVRALKNFGFRDLRLVRPREFDGYRIEGIAHQTRDVLARVTQYEGLDEALADCVHVVGFTARERSAKRNRQRPRQAEGVLRTVREVIHRTPLDEREAKLLRAMAIEVVKYGERLARSGIHVDRE